MRRRTIGLALTLTASVSVAGAPAEAVTRPDPVAALKRQPYGWYPDPPDYMAAGKSWNLNTRNNDLFLECGQIRLSDPATLRHLLSTTKVKRPAGVYDGTRTTLYEGSTTIGNLYKLNPRLWVGLFEPDSPWNVKVRRVVTADMRFSGWGDAVEIEPPPAEEVATQDELVFPDFDLRPGRHGKPRDAPGSGNRSHVVGELELSPATSSGALCDKWLRCGRASAKERHWNARRGSDNHQRKERQGVDPDVHLRIEGGHVPLVQRREKPSRCRPSKVQELPTGFRFHDLREPT